MSPRSTLPLQNSLAQSRANHFDAEQRRFVVQINHRIYFNDFKRNHRLAVRDHLHCEVSFAVGDAAANGSADAGRVARVHEVHIEADGDSVGVVTCKFDCLAHHFAQAALVDVAHGEDMYAGILDEAALLRVKVAHADQHDVARLDS